MCIWRLPWNRFSFEKFFFCECTDDRHAIILLVHYLIGSAFCAMSFPTRKAKSGNKEFYLEMTLMDLELKYGGSEQGRTDFSFPPIYVIRPA